ncbi:hypothetical protein [Citricoccus sp. NR2]|uniref:hypothetical protein n=1 Tax=Citricoccus sp. NR2 TaxID=3004095 RepID=UPI0022DD350B|nr:hypothetical protein [Citricoccus sp. NR2]WBL18532.1 hypothetical protein O1A05_12295 [Citricoccus sp. NR2]
MTQAIIRDTIPGAYRKAIYAGYAVLGVIIGAIQVGYASAELGQPTWLTVALSVYAFVGGAVGITATTYTPRAEDTDTLADVEDGSVDFARHEDE